MKALLLILVVSVSAQEWKLIKEMSGEIPDHPGLTIQTHAAEIARGDDIIKLKVRFSFPDGAPFEMFRKNAPPGFDLSSISYFIFKAEFNCDTLVMKAVNNSGEVYMANGRRHKSKEPPFNVDAGNIFVKYFCEREESKPTRPPTLKPGPTPLEESHRVAVPQSRSMAHPPFAGKSFAGI